MKQPTLLSKIQTDQDKLLQMVLFGQPELDVALDAEKIRQLKSRISYSMFVPSLQDSDVQAYLNYRMRKAGYSGLDVFDLKVSKKIQNITKGLPRNINVVADKVLMSIFGSGDNIAKSKHLKSLPELEAGTQTTPLRSYYLVITILLFIILSLSFLIFSNFFKIPFSAVQKSTSLIEDMSAVSIGSVAPEGGKRPSKSEFKSNDNSALGNESGIKVMSRSVGSPDTDSTINDKVNKEQNNTLLMDHLEGSNTTRQVNYQIKNPSAMIGNPQQLQRIMSYHSNGKAWLESLNEKYVIQLSTGHISTIDAILRFHQKNKMNADLIHIVVDYSKKNNNYRLKVFYLASSIFSDLSQEIDNLPTKYKSASPYIVRVDQVVQNLRYTDKKLQEVGILNE